MPQTVALQTLFTSELKIQSATPLTLTGGRPVTDFQRMAWQGEGSVNVPSQPYTPQVANTTVVLSVLDIATVQL